MKTKKLGLISAIVLTMVFLFALNASAAWYTCTVKMAGPGGANISNVYIMLTDNADTPAFVDRWFYANAQLKKEILATALTALSNGMVVTVNLSSTAQYSIINNLYLCP